MRKIFALILVLILVLGLAACGNDLSDEDRFKNITFAQNLYLNRDISWGMSQNEVSDIESKWSLSEGRNALEYDTLIRLTGDAQEWSNYDGWHEGISVEVPVKAYYLFVGNSITDNELATYYFVLNNTHISPKLAQYKTVKNMLTLEYGECLSEDFQWSDEFYKGDETRWEDAFEAGDLSILTLWTLNDAKTLIFLEWDSQNGCGVKFIGTEYADRL